MYFLKLEEDKNLETEVIIPLSIVTSFSVVHTPESPYKTNILAERRSYGSRMTIEEIEKALTRNTFFEPNNEIIIITL